MRSAYRLYRASAADWSPARMYRTRLRSLGDRTDGSVGGFGGIRAARAGERKRGHPPARISRQRLCSLGHVPAAGWGVCPERCLEVRCHEKTEAAGGIANLISEISPIADGIPGARP